MLLMNKQERLIKKQPLLWAFESDKTVNFSFAFNIKQKIFFHFPYFFPFSLSSHSSFLLKHFRPKAIRCCWAWIVAGGNRPWSANQRVRAHAGWGRHPCVVKVPEHIEYKEGNLMSIRAQAGWGHNPCRKVDLHEVPELVQVLDGSPAGGGLAWHVKTLIASGRHPHKSTSQTGY